MDMEAFCKLQFDTVKAAFEQFDVTCRQLANVFPTNLDGERVPCLVKESAEGDPAFSSATTGEKYVDTPTTTKRDAFVEVMKGEENDAISQCVAIGQSLGHEKLSRLLACFLGLTNTYRLNGGGHPTYEQIRSISDLVTNYYPRVALDDMHSIRLAKSICNQSGCELRQIFVPSALKMKAQRILCVAQQYIEGLGEVEVLSHPVADGMGISKEVWFAGDFRNAFAWMENWPLTAVVAAPEGEETDSVSRMKFSHRGTPAVMDPNFAFRFGD